MTPGPGASAAEAIERRRSARRFDPGRPVPGPLLERLLGLAALAPSPFNLQPWRFLVVRRPAHRRALRACAFGQPRLTDAPVVVVVLGYHHPIGSHLDAVADRMRDLGAVTPEGAAEFRARAAQASGRVGDPALWASRTAALAAATLMIAAESLGVASALIDEFDPWKVKEAFGVPDDHTVCGLVALGYSSEPPPFPGRLGLDAVCYAEHFGQPWDPEGG